MAAVSLIIPCHNDGAYLGEALQSALGQTRPPDEIIVVDDGSTDNSADIARRHGERVRLISQANQGISGARNTGAAHAGGEIITFLDADDLWPTDSLRVRLDRLEAQPTVDCVFGLSDQFFSPELDEAARAKLHCPTGEAAARFAGAMLIRRAAYDRVGPFNLDLRAGEMMEWATRLKISGIAVDTVQALVMRRRIHGANSVLQIAGLHSQYLRALKASLDRSKAAALSEA